MSDREIFVRDVIEKNDCAGKKFIFVTATEEEDEFIRSRFILTRAYMFPEDKLALSSVSPMDKVGIAVDSFAPDLLVTGEYFKNYSDLTKRDPSCRCGTLMVSDGFDIICPNMDCGLTLVARLERLGKTFFTHPEHDYLDPMSGELRVGELIGESANYYQPFLPILQGIFWGEPGGTVENMFLTRDFGHISLATFLIPSLFTELNEKLERIRGSNFFGTYSLSPIRNLYGDLDEVSNRRDTSSSRQNNILQAFLRSLGIESLSDQHILQMITYECTMGGEIEPMLMYAYLLTHPGEMIRELGFHFLEANAILSEVKRRRYELCDIFSHYTNKNSDVLEAFRHIM